MTVIGFNFTKINVEKKNTPKGKVNISNNITILDVDESTFVVGLEEQNTLKVSFRFNSSYDPEVGFIELLGDLIYVDEKAKIKDMVNEWKKTKKIAKEVMTELLNVVLNRCNIQALMLARDINLPSPIPLPKVKVEAR